MPSVLDRVVGVATRPFTRSAEVVAVADLGEHLRRIDLRVDGRPTWAPGQKLQLRTCGVDFRTYTPFDWQDDRVALLVLTDGTGPGTAWAAAAHPGVEVQVAGPRRAVDLESLPAAPILVGDETSLALAAAWQHAGSLPAAAQLVEASDPLQVESAAQRLDLGEVSVVARREDDLHHDELAARVVALLRSYPDSSLVLTGKAQSIAAIRAALKKADLHPHTRVKAHWDPRRKGLD